MEWAEKSFANIIRWKYNNFFFNAGRTLPAYRSYYRFEFRFVKFEIEECLTAKEMRLNRMHVL